MARPESSNGTSVESIKGQRDNHCGARDPVTAWCDFVFACFASLCGHMVKARPCPARVPTHDLAPVRTRELRLAAKTLDHVHHRRRSNDASSPLGAHPKQRLRFWSQNLGITQFTLHLLDEKPENPSTNAYIRTVEMRPPPLWCRLAAREISSLMPILKENDVRLVGVGLEPLGVEEFMENKFFEGDLFIDMEKKSYRALGFKRMSFLGLFPAVLAKKAREITAKAKALGLGGNMRGDGFQNGGALVVEKGGEQTLLTYVQQEAHDHVSNEEVLKALGINVARVPHADDDLAAS